MSHPTSAGGAPFDGKSQRVLHLVESVMSRREAGEELSDQAVIDAHPELLPELVRLLESLGRVRQAESLAGVDTAAGVSSSWGRDLSEFPTNAIAGYTLRGEIHRGGQGVVYQALQNSTGRIVAIKVMRDGPFRDPNDAARFRREVRLLAQLKHPNIVTIHDSGIAAGNHFFVMDYVQGRNLDEHLAQARRTIRQTLSLFAKICEAVSAAHLRGIIHRDLKPGNIRIDEQGESNILDFGLAKFASEQDEATRSRTMTITGQFVGSLPWASPEQADGTPEQIDLRTDVYSLGVVLYQMLTGRFPYEIVGKMREVLGRILDAEPVRPSKIRPDIDDEVETIVLKCLAKDRDRRYQSAGELARDVRHYLADEAIEAKRESTMYLLRKQMRRHRVALGVAAAFAMLVIASAIVGWTLYLGSQRNLWQSYLAQAHAHRVGGQAGQRFDALAAVEKAAAIRPSIELRDEAIAAMALPDLHPVAEIHFGGGEDMIFDETMTRYAAWGTDRPCIVRTVENQREVCALTGSGTPLPFPDFGPEGRVFARAVSGGCEIWNVDTCELETTLDVQPSGFASLSFDPSGNVLAAGTRDGSIRLYNRVTREDKLLPSLGSAIGGVLHDPSGKFIATVSLPDHEALIRDAFTGDVLQRYPHPQAVWGLAWSHDSRTLATGCEDNIIRLCDTRTGQIRILGRHDRVPSKLRFCPADDVLLSSGWDGVSKLWDIEKSNAVLQVSGTHKGMADQSRRVAMYQRIQEGVISLCDLVLERECRTLRGAKSSKDKFAVQLGFHANGRLVVGGNYADLQLWDWTAVTPPQVIDEGEVRFTEFHRKSGDLITVAHKGVFRWPVDAGTDGAHVGPPERLWRADTAILEASLSFDGNLLTFTVNGSGAFVLDLEKRETPWHITDHAGVYFVAVSPDDQWVVTGTSAAYYGVRIWNVRERRLEKELESNLTGVRAEFSPDGRWLVTNSSSCALWEVGTWRLRGRIPHRGNFAISPPVAFAPDGRMVAVCETESGVALVDRESWQVMARFARPGRSETRFVRFSPDGASLIVSSDGQNAVDVWDLRAVRAELGRLGLNWDLPPYSPAPAAKRSEPIKIEVDLGELAGEFAAQAENP